MRPAASGEFGMFLAGRWYRLTLRPELVPAAIRSGGCRSRCWRATCSSRCSASPTSAPTSASTSSAARAAWKGWSGASRSGEMAAAFALYPTQMTDLMAVADAGGIMPPKSTWFEPKLADGMVNHVLDAETVDRIRKGRPLSAAPSSHRCDAASVDRQRHEQHVAFGGRDQQQRGLLARLLQLPRRALHVGRRW